VSSGEDNGEWMVIDRALVLRLRAASSQLGRDRATYYHLIDSPLPRCVLKKRRDRNQGVTVHVDEPTVVNGVKVHHDGHD
jgi:hypothetical protein